MINLRDVEAIIGLITFFLAYVVVVTIAGFFRAWTARQMGDATAEQLGFMTLNPLMHIDPFGLIFLFLLYFGWGRHVPVNPFNIYGRFRKLRLILVHLADVAAYLLIAILGIILLIFLFDVQILGVARIMISNMNYLTHLYLAHMYPQHPSLTISLGFITVAIVYLSVVLGVLHLIVNTLSIGIFLFAERRPLRYGTYNNAMILLISLILIIFFSGPLRLLAINVITYIGYFIARILGMI